MKVRKEDLGLLKRMIDPVKEEASAATTEFLQLHLESVEELKKQFDDEETLLQPSLTRSVTVGGNVLVLLLIIETRFIQVHLLMQILQIVCVSRGSFLFQCSEFWDPECA